MKNYGIPDESCLPYNATDNKKWGEENAQCPPEGECLNCMYIQGTQQTDCWPVKTFTKYRAKRWGRVVGEVAMMKEIYKRGPITCGISCPDGFTYDYREGVFEDKTNNRDVDHDIEVVGWGEEDGVKYWHVRNSWGTYWGMNGFIKVIRGKDNIAIESDCWWVEPDLTEVKLVSGDHPRYGGSQYGILDMKQSALKSDLVETVKESSTVTEQDLVQTEVEPVAADEVQNVAVSSHSAGSSALVLLAFGSALVALYVNRDRLDRARQSIRRGVSEYTPIA